MYKFFVLLALSLAVFGIKAQTVGGMHSREVSQFTPSERAFMATFCSHAIERIKSDCKLPQNFDLEEAERCLNDIAEYGDAVKVGTDDECRPICVIVQGALEKVLTEMKQNGEILTLSAVYVTPLPATPLRTSSTQEFSHENLSPESTYSVTLRQDTVRAMRGSGANIFCAYHEGSYITQLEERAIEQIRSKLGGKELSQLAIYLNELNYENTFDIPMLQPDPEGYVGAMYCFTTKADEKYYMITEGTQVQDASLIGQKQWRHSLIPSSYQNHERVSKVNKVIGHINRVRPENSPFILF